MGGLDNTGLDALEVAGGSFVDTNTASTNSAANQNQAAAAAAAFRGMNRQHGNEHHHEPDAALMLQLQQGMAPFPQAVSGMGHPNSGMDLSAFQQSLSNAASSQPNRSSKANGDLGKRSGSGSNNNGGNLMMNKAYGGQQQGQSAAGSQDAQNGDQGSKKRNWKRKAISSGRTTVIVTQDSTRKRDTTLGDNAKVAVVKGRFSDEEKRKLFRLIREDEGLFHSFLHQRKERMYGTKSWMHEITRRYNELIDNKRSLEAVRHHLMFRRIPAQPGGKQGTDQMLEEHAGSCESPGTCTKCLIFQRVCVQNGIARCGYVECTDCKPELPHVDHFVVLNPEDAPKRMQRQGGHGGVGSVNIANGNQRLFRPPVDNVNPAATRNFLQHAAAGLIHPSGLTIPGFDAHENSSDSTAPINDVNAAHNMGGDDAFGYNQKPFKPILPQYMSGSTSSPMFNMISGLTGGSNHNANGNNANGSANGNGRGANGSANGNSSGNNSAQKFLGASPGSSPTQRRFDAMAALESSANPAGARTFNPGALNTLLSNDSAALSDATQSNASTPSHIALQMQGLANNNNSNNKKRRMMNLPQDRQAAMQHAQQQQRGSSSGRFDSQDDYFHYSNQQFQQQSHAQHQQHQYQNGQNFLSNKPDASAQFSYQQQFQANRSMNQAPPPPPPVSHLHRGGGLPGMLEWHSS
mmetsp:Transcript_12021/g.23528  ORF Transcript_12021/g.23528 Transcript_12021/m.23528 type:complete len:690 (-) Transcript_12021:654-2723(-)|eukprot:CAMPEP_0171495434 /NCGR_PEP_ID=MMETSP0958-20121227/6144_1 /TAXON_ID=87120 /ORGANISM="Aurantiochytrium limacinum, Strain ATCCMYA-1381" /LENGTH=689 /DNA_ID=CAMNT_0012029425 /DNA_START=218 /DNA_END=2287 /DNA_ORIENTATION=+